MTITVGDLFPYCTMWMMLLQLVDQLLPLPRPECDQLHHTVDLQQQPATLSTFKLRAFSEVACDINIDNRIGFV